MAYIVRRQSVYYLNLRLPKHLLPNRHTLRISLRVRERQAALFLASSLAQQVNSHLIQHPLTAPVINEMLVDLMATIARLDQEKRVERIKQGLDNKRARGEKVGGKGRNQKKWDQVVALLKRNGNTMEEIAKLAEVGVATVYRIKKEISL